jgi:3-hydroxymyristoyl/3-hydroxydecanoyl-(acyl carrier protein) dehydratase
VLLPKKWRFVDSLPLNPQGKLLRDDLLPLFEQPQDTQARDPQIRQVSVAGTTATLSLFIPSNLLYFSGHFPGKPVLPGVVQVDWAIKFAREYLRVPDGFHRMEAVKFHAFITPNAILQLTLRYDPAKETLHFTYTSHGRRFSSGRIVLGARE